jgi:hypothetical protein
MSDTESFVEATFVALGLGPIDARGHPSPGGGERLFTPELDPGEYTILVRAEGYRLKGFASASVGAWNVVPVRIELSR